MRSLAAQAPHFFTFATAGLTVPPELRENVVALPYTHDPAPLRALAPQVPGDFVDAVALTGAPDDMAGEIVRLARGGITQLVV